jgi:hypothetical protein
MYVTGMSRYKKEDIFCSEELDVFSGGRDFSSFPGIGKTFLEV